MPISLVASPAPFNGNLLAAFRNSGASGRSSSILQSASESTEPRPHALFNLCHSGLDSPPNVFHSEFNKFYERGGLALAKTLSRRGAATYVGKQHTLSERHACRLIGIARSTKRYRSRSKEREMNLRHQFIDPGKPMQSCFIESFNGRSREECPNANWFVTLTDARRKIEAWRRDYNEERPHSSLGYLAPRQFAQLAHAGA